MSKNVVTIILCGVCLLLGLLLMKSCDKQDEITKRYEDSIRIRDGRIDSTQKAGQKILTQKDSVVAKSFSDSAKSRHREDSILAENKILKGQYRTYRDSANSLWQQLKTDYLSGDTVALRQAYYGLREQLDSANSLVVQIQLRDQRVEYELRNEADSAHAVVRTLSSQLDILKILLDNQTQIAKAATKEEAHIIAAQKRKKIWDIIQKVGLGIAGLIIGGKL